MEDGSSVFYASPGSLNAGTITSLVKAVEPVAVYLNSMFSFSYTLRPLYVLRKMSYKGRIVLAPRGMLKSSALSHKPVKKKIFLTLASLAGLGKNILFHATDEQEKMDVIKHFGNNAEVVVAANVPAVPSGSFAREKKPDQLKLIYLSRIHPIKNLSYALELLPGLSGKTNIIFDIYGSVEDEEYYRHCFDLARKLEKKVSIHFCGGVEYQEVHSLLKQYHLFLLPTLGENFGHAIFDAMAAGCPVLISDQTPWKNLEEYNAGWAISLQQPAKFTEVLERLYSMDNEEYAAYPAGAHKFAESYVRQQSENNRYPELFTGSR